MFVPFWFRYPTPHRSFEEGGACPGLLVGWGTPTVPTLVRTGYPLQGTSRWVYTPFSGTHSRRRLNSCHRPKWRSGGGTPRLPSVQDPNPPVLPKEGGTPLGRYRGGIRQNSHADKIGFVRVSDITFQEYTGYVTSIHEYWQMRMVELLTQAFPLF